MSLVQTKPVPQRLDNNPNVTTVLYNGMIAPLVPFGVKGGIFLVLPQSLHPKRICV